MLMASSDKAESMEVACLGQEFQLGMLYNCHRDQLVRGECFWNSETLVESTKSSPPKRSREYKILRENTIESKGEVLNIGDDLLLSFLAGMVTVKGSAKFLHDELATSKTQRVALFVQCTDRCDHLQVEELGSFPSSDMVKVSEATHIVTGITFGASAFFVFHKTGEYFPDSRAALEVKTEMESVIKSIPEMLATDEEKAKMLELKCTLHSDITWQKNPSTWDEAVKAYEELKNLSMLVPIKAQLEPLSKYNDESGCAPVSLISHKVATEFVRMLEYVQSVNFDSICLLECYPVCSYFKGLEKQLTQFQHILKQYIAKSAKFLQKTLPMVRSGVLKEEEITNFLKLTSTSRFAATHLSSWLEKKEEEVQYLTGKLQGLQDMDFAFASDEFFKIIGNDDYDNVLCLNISLADQDSALFGMSDYLLNETSKYEPEVPWYKDKKEMRHIRDTIRHFKEFAMANRENKGLKCIVSSRSEEGKHCIRIICYECGISKDLLPPGPPSNIEAHNVTDSSVELTWAEPTIGATNVETYCVSYHSSESLADKWHEFHIRNATRCLVIDNLQPATCYEFKVRAVCTAGCSQESDVLSIKTVAHFKKIDKPGIFSAKTKHSLYLNKPNVLKITCHTVTLGWSEPKGATEDVHEYAVEYCLLSSSTKAWERFEEVLKGTVKKSTITGLHANSVYSFRVIAFFPSKQCIASDVTDKVSTKSYLLKKPCISDISDSGVMLNWIKPEESDIQQYSILCQSSYDSAEAWNPVGSTIAGHKHQSAISGLSPRVKYSFKIVAHCEDGTMFESDISRCQTQSLVTLKKPQLSCAQQHMITLLWVKPSAEEARRIQNYYIAYRPQSAPTEEWIKQPMVIKTNFIPIAELKSYTSYNFKIIALLKSGREVESPHSDFIKTKPPSKLAKPGLSSVTEQGLLVSWSKPEGVCVDYYTVFCRTQKTFGTSSTWMRCSKIQITEEAFRVEGLCSGSGYVFKVVACYEGCKIIESDNSDRCEIKRRTFVLHKPVITDVTDQSVSLQWSKPEGADESEYQVKRYTVRYYAGTTPGKKCTSLTTNRSCLSTTVFKLSHDTEYAFDLCATMISGDTVYSKQSDIIMTKPLCCPGIPKASTNCITDDSIQIFWEKPSSCSEAVISYSILYWKKDEHFRNKGIQVQNTTETRKVLDGLEPVTKYTFKIRANRKHGKSFESEEATYQTQPICGVSDVQVMHCTDHTATISWSKVDSCACIKCFEVCYNSITLHPQSHTKKTTATAEEMSMKLENLTPASEYDCVVHALLNTDKIGKMVAQKTFTMADPCCPGKPKPLAQTNTSVSIEWSKPAYHYERVCGYTVIYRPIDEATNSHSVKIRSATESTNINNLRSSTFYYFVVKPVTDDPDLGVCSERSEAIRTNDECRPGKPDILTIRDTSIQLRWAAPQYGASEVEYYEMHYRCTTDPEKWAAFKQFVYAERDRIITVSGLQPKTEYEFKVHVSSRGNLVCVDSYTSSPTSTKAEPPAKKLQKKCTLVRKEAPMIYQLPVNTVPFDGNKMLQKCEIGEADKLNPGEEKVLMLVGATGAGKTTLMNGITNYIFGVSWEHNFRFRLIGDEGAESQAHSQTQSVTAYTFHKMEGSFLDYTLTIVDTPGFGDTRGLEQDKVIMNLIEQFFSKPGGITFLNGIGFVAQASLPRLTPTQRYIFDTVLGIFGKDVINSISIMATFADGKKPPLYAAIDKAEFSIQGKYTFNNSGLYEGPESQFASLFFEMGVESFRSFFQQFQSAECISLVLTKEVLSERRRLETTIQSLQEQIYEALCKMDKLHNLEQVLESHKAKIDESKNFTISDTETKVRKVDLSSGVFTTTCMQCNRTCHENCIYANNDDKFKCCAIGHDGMCHNCPKHCHWQQHMNTPFKLVVEAVPVVTTLKELEKVYYKATSERSKSQEMIKNVKCEYECCIEQAHDLVKRVKKCLEHLAEIALRPNPRTEEEYIDLLIDAEKREKKINWNSRVQSYEKLKKRAKLLQSISRGEDILKK